ncbi:NADH:ubiquinone reductase (Na(+)-transporting) subunit C [Robertkochia marina]|uniref:Na(+)-translocating NADH-quinone reductase subunit C n=1 Tax=Robertkochia marina TaxID=1227945 RepID=A0A4S3LYT7_9FLAO|nr:NADH:ubiquinone reductase (Na(+)-transporting) subunit C [Robertkochia marina]THD66311.1 NADH:ubiquinone reductase (Na(+)-transporting) subunit C [Robertkochia marina]TRZ41231.1 NADH:ubiquinone reductase (Na(+)-transporting) subunit C [Robertkochia marina]
MNRDSNAYTFIFATVMVIVVAASLAIAATSLKPMQNENVRKEKMQNILSTIGVEVEREQAGEEFNKYIKEQISLTADGSIDESVNAFNIDLAKELKKPVEEQRFPLYKAEIEGKQYFIIPLRGAGLWDAIWGYISLEDDINTIKGAVFDHKGETPGLGAEITQSWFEKRFEEEKIFDPESGEFVGVTVMKGYSGGNNKDDNAIDAISGATITGDGVTDMIYNRLQYYMPYLKQQNVKVALNN